MKQARPRHSGRTIRSWAQGLAPLEPWRRNLSGPADLPTGADLTMRRPSGAILGIKLYTLFSPERLHRA